MSLSVGRQNLTADVVDLTVWRTNKDAKKPTRNVSPDIITAEAPDGTRVRVRVGNYPHDAPFPHEDDECPCSQCDMHKDVP